MPTMRIYRARRKVESIDFQNRFTILSEIQGERDLFWVAEGEPALGDGAFRIQIRKDANGDYEIDSVGTDWQLILDNVAMDTGIYVGVSVAGRTVELRQGVYRFVCSFPPSSGKRRPRLKDTPPYKQFFPLLDSATVTMHIYKAGRRIDLTEFVGQFYIGRNKEGGLYWSADNEQLSLGGGEIQIWIIGGGTTEREIKSVGPDWQLTIDGIVMDRGIYFDVYVSGKTIELEYSDYRFVCSFPPFGGRRVLRSEDAPPYVFVPVSKSQ